MERYTFYLLKALSMEFIDHYMFLFQTIHTSFQWIGHGKTIALIVIIEVVILWDDWISTFSPIIVQRTVHLFDRQDEFVGLLM